MILFFLPVFIYSQTKCDYMNFLTSLSFQIDDRIGGVSLCFMENTYYVEGHYSGRIGLGNFEVQGNKVILKKSEIENTDGEFPSVNGHSFIWPGTYLINMDYADLYWKGALCDGDGGFFPQYDVSPAWQQYEYKGIKVTKYPFANDKDVQYVYPVANLKMREKPSTDADTISMGWGYSNNKRIVIFEGDIHRVIAATTEKATIDGLTAPWYLVEEWDHCDEEGGYYETVWIFGGYCEIFGNDKIECYKQKGEKVLPKALRKAGFDAEQ